MIEKLAILLIEELGPVGLLIVGLYWVLGQHLKKISNCVENINHNTTKMTELMQHCSDRICDSIDGKN